MANDRLIHVIDDDEANRLRSEAQREPWRM